MKTFMVNGKEYKSKMFDFNLVCEMEDLGVSIEQIRNKPISAIRAYFSLCANLNKNAAGKEIEAHIISGKKLDDVMNIIFEEMENSDFFRVLNETAETEAATDKTAENTETGEN